MQCRAFINLNTGHQPHIPVISYYKHCLVWSSIVLLGTSTNIYLFTPFKPTLFLTLEKMVCSFRALRQSNERPSIVGSDNNGWSMLYWVHRGWPSHVYLLFGLGNYETDHEGKFIFHLHHHQPRSPVLDIGPSTDFHVVSPSAPTFRLPVRGRYSRTFIPQRKPHRKWHSITEIVKL